MINKGQLARWWLTSQASKATHIFSKRFSLGFLDVALGAGGVGDALGVDEGVPLEGAEKDVEDRYMAAVILRHKVVVVNVVP